MSGLYEATLRVDVCYEATLTIEAESQEAAEAALGMLSPSDLEQSSRYHLPDGVVIDIRSDVMDAEVEDWDVEIEVLEEPEDDDEE